LYCDYANCIVYERWVANQAYDGIKAVIIRTYAASSTGLQRKTAKDEPILGGFMSGELNFLHVFRQRRSPGVGHEPIGDQSLGDRAIRRSPCAALAPRREALGVFLAVDALHDAVDPAVAQRCLDQLLIGDGLFARGLFVDDHPDVFIGLPMRRKPVGKVLGGLYRERFANVHAQNLRVINSL